MVVVKGTGEGQVRQVVSKCNGSSTITVDRPFAVELTSSSLFSLVPFIGRWVIAGNLFGTRARHFSLGNAVLTSRNWSLGQRTEQSCKTLAFASNVSWQTTA